MSTNYWFNGRSVGGGGVEGAHSLRCSSININLTYKQNVGGHRRNASNKGQQQAFDTSAITERAAAIIILTGHNANGISPELNGGRVHRQTPSVVVAWTKGTTYRWWSFQTIVDQTRRGNRRQLQKRSGWRREIGCHGTYAYTTCTEPGVFFSRSL